MTRAARILVVDDEKLIRWSLRETLSGMGFEVTEAADGLEALAAVDREQPDIVLLDVRLPGADGLTVLSEIRKRGLETTVAMMSAHGTLELAVQAMKAGAADFIRKPFEEAEIQILISRLTDRLDLEREAQVHRSREERRYPVSSLVGVSPSMQGVRELVTKIAGSAATNILVEGESGTGKGLVSRVIHYAGTRARRPFVEVSCTALQETLVESELFGHEKGAFTDAKVTKKGLFELADGGTIFLDEIGDLPLSCQAKLLRVLEDRAFKRVGGVQDIRVDARVVAATNRDLAEEAASGRFRRDLYYRLAVLRIGLRPLRERPEDIPVLARTFLAQFNCEFHRHYERIHPEAMELLSRYPWPGNVRELRNAIERVVILQDGREIRADDLLMTPPARPAPTASALGDGSVLEIPLGAVSLDEVERELIERALEHARGNQTRAASLLGLSRDTLRYRMKKYGLSQAGGA